MKLALMQPYFFPYIGYFQLIDACDKFVVYDDVKYIKGGWINRNRILVDGRPGYITLPLKKESTSLNINQRHLSDKVDIAKINIKRQIENAYRKAPFYSNIFDLVEKIFSLNESRLSIFLEDSLKQICNYLDITTPFFLSSELTKTDTLKGEERVVEINKIMGANHYINPIGGRSLYGKDVFYRQGIKLSFIQTKKITYKQFRSEHVPFLSIIDVLMFNTPEQVRGYLKQYSLAE